MKDEYKKGGMSMLAHLSHFSSSSAEDFITLNLGGLLVKPLSIDGFELLGMTIGGDDVLEMR